MCYLCEPSWLTRCNTCGWWETYPDEYAAEFGAWRHWCGTARLNGNRWAAAFTLDHPADWPHRGQDIDVLPRVESRL